MTVKTKNNKGDRYGSLVLLNEVAPYIFPSGQKQRMFLFQCDCGKKKEIVINRVKTGNTRSCGCSHVKHNLRKHPLYYIWSLMKQRCSNPKYDNYHLYGGRGIKVCDKWINDFKEFYDDVSDGYKKGLQLDRRNNNGNYEPENCRWVTCTVNNQNRRSTKLTMEKAKHIRFLSKNGTKTKAIADKYGVTQSTVNYVIRDKIWKELK